MWDKFIEVGGKRVSVGLVEAALKKLFDAVPRGKFAALMHDATLVELCVRAHIKAQLDKAEDNPNG